MDREFLLDRVNNTENLYTKIHDFIFQDGNKLIEFADWKEDHWLCETCFGQLLKEHLHLWLLEEKRKCMSYPLVSRASL